MNIAQRNAARNMYEGQGKQVNEEEEGNSSSSLCPVCALLLFNKIFFLMPAGRLYSCTPRRVKCASYLDPAATPTGGKREININNNPRPFTAINHSAFKVLYLFFFTLRRGREGRKQQQDTDEDNSTQISFVTIASIATSYFQTLFFNLYVSARRSDCN